MAGGRLDRLFQRPRARRAFLRRMAVHGERVEPADVVAFIRDMVECPTFKPLIKSLLNDQLGPITDTAGCPIRIAWGERDRLIPYRHFGPPMCERVPVAEFRTLPGVGHVPMPDDPALVARTILEVTRAADAGELST